MAVASASLVPQHGCSSVALTGHSSQQLCRSTCPVQSSMRYLAWPREVALLLARAARACRRTGHSPDEIATALAKKRKAAKQTGPSASSVRLALRGGSFKRGRVETRGRKPALSLRNLSTINKTREALIKKVECASSKPSSKGRDSAPVRNAPFSNGTQCPASAPPVPHTVPRAVPRCKSRGIDALDVILR